MIDQDVLYGLVQAAQGQQEAVDKALRGLQAQQVQLGNTIAQLQGVQAKVAEDARKGAQRGLQDMSSKANAALDAEVERARRTIGDVAEVLRVRVFAKSIEWIGGCLVAGLLLGLVLGWFAWGRDGLKISNRLDGIEQTLRQQAASAHPAKTLHALKPRSQSGQSEPQEQP